jgi:hypothetical protein
MSVDNHLRANCFADPVTLYELGDYFMVPELCEDALQLLTTKFNKAVGIIQKHHLGQPQSSKKQTTGQRIMDLSDIKPSKLYESFSEVVGMIYAHGALSSKKTLRDLLVSFFTRTQLFLIRKDSSAFHFLSETPQFAADILSSHGTFGLGMTEINIPKHCFKCQKNIVDGPEDIRFDKLCFTHKQSHGHDYYGHNNSTMLFVSAYCQHCARATENRLSRSSVAPAADIVLLSEFEL